VSGAGDGGAPAADERAAREVVLDAAGVTKRFAGAAEPALAALDVQVRAGRVTGLVGSDGAGKTTLLRLAAGLLVADEGTLRVLGLDAAREPLAIRGRIGYMPQRFGLYEELTVQENLDLYADLQAVPRAERGARFERLLAMTGLGDVTGRRAGALSGGMQQKLGLACSLIKSPGLLLLDEPTVGVDPVSRRELWTIVGELVEGDGIGVLLATSYLDEADRCDHVVVVDRGRAVDEGPPGRFHEQVRGRVFVVTPSDPTGVRALHTRLAAAARVRDARVRSGRVRCVCAEPGDGALREALPRGAVAAIEPAAPSFEDAFMSRWAEGAEVLAPGGAREPSGAERPGATTAAAHGRGGAAPAEGPVVAVRDLGKRFGDVTAVEGLDFEVGRGEIFGLLGPNGAGKTTTFRMMCGLMPPSGGELSVAGHDLRRSPARARARLGYVAQVFSLYGKLTVLQNLRFYARAYGLSGRRLRARLAWALEEFELGERRREEAGALPGGYRQRLAMAAATLHEPDILFLDEPTSGADPLARREFWLRIGGFAQRGVTVIVTTHFLEEAESCDRMLIMSQGRELAQGTPAEIRALARTPARPEPTIEDAFIALAEGARREEVPA